MPLNLSWCSFSMVGLINIGVLLSDSSICHGYCCALVVVVTLVALQEAAHPEDV